ncbi:MAG: ABC transporter ATP-binding protein [Pseudomonadota bacterium]
MLFRFFENLVPPFTDAPVEQPPATLPAFIWYYAKPFKGLLVATIFVSALIAGIEVYALDLVGNIVDWMGTTDPEGFWETYGFELLLICGLIAILWPALSVLDDLILLQGILGNMAMSVRWRGHRYLLGQSSSFFADDFAGRISTKLMQTATGARDVVIKVTNLMVYAAVYFISTALLFASNSLWLTIPLILWLILYIATMVIFLPRVQRWSEKQADERSNLTGRVVDAYTNIQTVKMFSSSTAEENYAKEGMENMLGAVYPTFQVVTAMSGSLHFINGLFIAGTISMGSLLWSQGLISVGALAAASAIAIRIQGLSHYFLWEMAALFEHIGAALDGMKTIAKPISVTDTPEAKALNADQGAIEFQKVTFHYGGDRKIITDLDLKVQPGEKVGLVGRSGAGKSTLVNLLLRLHDVEKGSILIDGQPIHEVSQDSLRHAIAVVTQDTSLLHRSIRENIAYGQPGATEADIIAAAKQAEAWDFIETLEDKKKRRGLDAHVGERGVKLSGGQRQRIAIARVILKNAPILVLDEATSALDSEVEAAIQGQLEGLMKGKTVIAIAHRLSTIAAMDRLIVLQEGRIVEEGPHATLVSKGGLYAQLWQRQSGGFLGAETSAAE